MFRGNEASKVGEVLAKKDAGDRAGMIAAARELWLSPRERDDEPDDAARDAWAAICHVGAADAAVAAALEVFRDRRTIRPHAFIDIIERITDPAVLFELADLALANKWPVHPYLASILLWLVDNQHEDALWKYMQANRSRLVDNTPGFTLGALILLTTRIGRSQDIADWFVSFEQREQLPLWIASAYAANYATYDQRTLMRLGEIARGGLKAGVPDRTMAFLIAHRLVADLASGDDGSFLSNYGATGSMLVPDQYRMEHPIVVYINGAKHLHAIGLDDFAFSMADYDKGPSIAMAVRTASLVRPTNWRVIVHLQEYDGILESTSRVLPLFAEVLGGEPDADRAVDLYREMKKTRPKIPALIPIWDRLMKARLGWFKRFKMDFL